MMALTPEDVRALQAPFAMKDHRFLQKKNKDGQVVAELAYVPERPTTDRLDSIDRDWTFNILSKERSAKQVVIHAVLTIKGVSRENIGMQKVDDEYGEAEKGATTDALRRCARMFGIARYTLDAPKNRNEFGAFLAKLQQEYATPQNAPQAAQQRVPPIRGVVVTPAVVTQATTPAAEPVPGTTAIGPYVTNSTGWAVVKRDTLQDCYQGNEFHQNGSIEKGLKDGWLTEAMTISAAIMAIRVHRREIDTLKLVFPRVESTYTQKKKDDRFQAFVTDAYRLYASGKIKSIENEDEVVAQVQLDLLGELA